MPGGGRRGWGVWGQLEEELSDQRDRTGWGRGTDRSRGQGRGRTRWSGSMAWQGERVS